MSSIKDVCHAGLAFIGKQTLNHTCKMAKRLRNTALNLELNPPYTRKERGSTVLRMSKLFFKYKNIQLLYSIFFAFFQFEDSEEEYNIGKPKYITIKGKRRRIISLVDQLRESYSELADDKLLVKHLADIMRTKKAPPPPPNFCKVNVIHGEVTYE